MARSSAALELDGSAALRKLVALLQAGLQPVRARELVESELGALPQVELRLIDYVWSVATKAGGSMSAVILRLADVMQARREAEREAQLAYASPRATARLVLVLPFIAIVMGELLGMHPLLAIFKSSAGAISVALGLLLLVVGKIWSDRMLKKATPVIQDDAILLDAFVIALSAGMSISSAKKLAFDEFELASQLSQSEMKIEIDEASQLSVATGASLVEVVRALADEKRKLQNFDRANSLAKLSVKLMIPLGIAVLPAFVLLSVVPIAISLLVSSNIQ